ncbi:hypothetical protein [Streptomyces sp. NPDC058757]|uniref:hypothetical protein n=1 Tax=Streptomyces sp. NPDC058757 TaxID=3346626 RepID=UPI003687CC6B
MERPVLQLGGAGPELSRAGGLQLAASVTAIQQYDKGPAGDPQTAIDRLAEVFENLASCTREAAPPQAARDFLQRHADDLAAWLAHRPHTDPQQPEGAS